MTLMTHNTPPLFRSTKAMQPTPPRHTAAPLAPPPPVNGTPEPYVKTVVVTPAMATEMLERNTANRDVREYKVAEYAAAMKAGKWVTKSYEMIKLTASGDINNGQHRLRAVVASGCSIPFEIVYNIAPEVMVITDTGIKRNGADVFRIRGIKYDRHLPSIIQTALGIFAGYASRGSARMSNQDLLDEYHKDEEFWQKIAKAAIHWYPEFSKVLQPSFIGGIYACLNLVDDAKSEAFMEQLCTGDKITNATILVLRKKLIEDRTSVKHLPQTMKLAYIIRAWNAFRRGEVLRVIKYNPELHDFPTIE